MDESITPAASLTAAEADELARCEAVIERGLKTFVEVGEALLLIRDRRLYRQTHSSFESYCRERWGMSRIHAHRLIDAAAVVENLLPIGNIPANEAQARPLASLPPAEQCEAWREVVETAGEHGITAEWVKRVVERKVAVKEGRPANPTSPPLPAGQYSLILADPPWRYDFSNTNGRAVELHYPTMAPESISALPVRDLAAPDCVLFLWATYPLLREALSVVEAWGFTYKSQLVWVKDKIGLGFYCRAQHELLLVATRGEPGAPEPANRPPSVIHAPRGRHSEKPETAYEIIEQMFPRARRVELFSRRHRPGWTAWGNEAPPPSVTNGSVN